MSYTIRQAVREDAAIIHHLGNAVYYSAYAAILSKEQIFFMLKKSYTPAAIRQTMDEGQDFYLLLQRDEPVGFIALQPKEDGVLRIEKLYLLAECQGKGYGAALIAFATQEATRRDCHKLELNVNRSNKAYNFYLKQGFVVIREVDIPYFGFVLDDYVMQREL